MPNYVATVTGDSGAPVVLLAGGAASSHGFFPGLVEALPDNRVVSFDRPGTGRAVGLGTATLPSGSAALAEFLTGLGAGPAVVVGQSLGGAAALQFAADHPELTAGLVLIDPSPLSTPKQMAMARRMFGILALPGRLPVVGRHLDGALFAALGRGQATTPEAKAALTVMTRSATLADTMRAIATFEEEAAALLPRLQPLDAPVVLLTADRKPGHDVRADHDRVVAALRGRLVAPTGAIHADHLRDPKGVNELVREVVAEASARRP